MRKQFILTILSGLLCASAFTQKVEIFGGAPLVHSQSSSTTAGWNAALNGKELGAIDESTNSCVSARSMLLEIAAWDRGGQHFHEVPIWRLPGSRAFFFVSGMTIDADGSPNAYNPDDTGLDELANAGAPANWNGIITDRDGNPLIQQLSDPFPGYYISCTSLSDKSKKFTDPTRYVDASKIPYVVLPKDVADRGGARLGDFAIVMNLRNGKSSFAIFADIGTLGEGSIALADALGIRSDARNGGESDGILYLLFPRSGNLQPRTMSEIRGEGEELLLHHWAGIKKLPFCTESDGPAGRGEF
jgi:glycosyl hydrolase group 75 (putative chitosanase)